jgi:AcrR family transcriptional regulator
MAMQRSENAKKRVPLSRRRVLRAAVKLADAEGLDAVSMRRLGQALGVEAMSLYNHVASKDDLLGGMVDLAWSEIELPEPGGDWRASVRACALSANSVLLAHPWACNLAMSARSISPVRLRYMEALLRTFREGGFPAALTYHAYHAVDSHVIGFTLWAVGHAMSADEVADVAERFLPTIATDHPYLAEHAEQHLAGFGRDGEGEFAFVLDLVLDGLERMRAEH